MIHISTITSKYQVTIPLEIRQKEGLKIGDKVMFQYTDEGDIIVRPLRKKCARELAGYLHKEDTQYLPFREARQITQDSSAARVSSKESGEV
ncbi:hypothetical protein GCM10025857_01530 [Alicyclobacillus contaminans]|nr:hypothetical protein GCM10025857_01530 [Alicyclobacillus contaminans]